MHIQAMDPSAPAFGCVACYALHHTQLDVISYSVVLSSCEKAGGLRLSSGPSRYLTRLVDHRSTGLFRVLRLPERTSRLQSKGCFQHIQILGGCATRV